MAPWWRKFVPTKNEREVVRLSARVPAINAFETKLHALPDEQLQAKTDEFRARYKAEFERLGGDPKRERTEGTKEEIKKERVIIDKALATILPEAFAVVREASIRVLGMRHFDVQMVGGMVLHEGKIAEMKTGEGKTLVATLPVYLNAIVGRGVHVVTVNEYLATRDAAWMGQIYEFLGMKVGVIVNGISDSVRQAAYKADITYGTNSEFGFDYLRDNMKLYLRDYVQRGLHFSIVDEVDSILVDEARTPLIISGPAESNTEKYIRINAIIPGLKRELDYTIDEKARTVTLTESGVTTVEERLNVNNLYEPENIELLHHVNQGLRAHTLFRRDVDYMVDEGAVKIIDEFTGRVLDGRRWSDGLHQAVEAKEGVEIENENQTLATITYQNYFRMFLKLAGMTGTAETESEEFAKIYDLDVVVIPTNQPVVRLDSDDLIYKTEIEKFHAIAEDIQDRATKGQPILVGTTSVEKSEVLAKLLKRLKIPHEVLNAKFHRREAEIVAQAGRKSYVTIATNMAGRGTDIVLGGNPDAMAKALAGSEDDEDAISKSAVEYKIITDQEREVVLGAGGLHIIGTERHESRRIDNQLRGRSGRQGDPGSSRFYLSLEDDLMRIFGGERLQGLMERLGMEDGEVIEHPWVNKSVEGAQRKVEGHNFDIRKNLLEYDDVMNDQRLAVYKLRRTVIGANTDLTKEMILDLVEDSVMDMVARACPERTHFDEWDLNGLEDNVHGLFDAKISLNEIEEASRTEIENRVFAGVQAAYDEKERLYRAEGFYGVGRVIFLQTIDSLWKEHLREMDNLREGIGLRGYAQKDPKQEYKKEGYNLFAGMMSTVSADVLMKVSRVVVDMETEEEYERRLERQRQVQMQFVTLGQGPVPPKGAEGEDAGPAKRQPKRRESAKVGPNDPCPCGSGKKYKKCHMFSDQAQA
ncbi:preprotein translocase subunit SecA [Myxococcota bacterium]|nr:preprotein translocase subunit SecA [Myxococcota bacterium]